MILTDFGRGDNRDLVPEPERLTVLTTFGPLATKVLGPNPATGRPAIIVGYGDAAHFRVGFLPARTIGELAAALTLLSGRRCSFVIRGEPLPGIDLARCRRLLHPHREADGSLTPATFGDAARRWLAADFDGVPVPAGLAWPEDAEATACHLAALLPPEFTGVSCMVQATASASIKPGIRARLWFLLDRAVTGAEARRWLRTAPLDRALLGAVQAHYTAAPVRRGVADPVPWRLRLARGTYVRVAVPPLPAPEEPRSVPPAPVRCDRNRYALAALAREAAAVAAAAAGGRHAVLNRAGFALARFVRCGELTAVEVVAELLAAARRAEIADPEPELRRFLRCGLRAGLERAGI